MISRITKFLEGLLRLNRAAEGLLIDIIAGFSPWLAPIVPAFMTFRSMTGLLGFPVWIAWAAAICVEFLGLAAVRTALEFWQWNDDKHKTDPRAPVFLAIIAGSFYLAVVLTVNVTLDNSPGLFRLAKALLSSLSVCAGLILALRAGHARRITEAEHARLERKAERAASRAERAALQAGKAGEKSLEKTIPFLEIINQPGNGNGARKEAKIR